MPIYEYRCPEGHVFELFQRFHEAQPEECEVCGEGPVARVLYPVAVHFKGSGFYSTDYGRGSRKKEGAADGDGAAPAKAEGDKPKKTEEKAKAAEA